MYSIIFFIVITAVDAAVLAFLIPKFIGDSAARTAPDYQESLMHCGIANGLSWFGAVVFGARMLGWAYFVYLFWHKLGLNKLAVLTAWIVMAICDHFAAHALASILFPVV